MLYLLHLYGTKKNPKGSYGIRSRNLLPTREKSKFQGFCRWTLCTPKITGTPQAALRSKVLDLRFHYIKT